MSQLILMGLVIGLFLWVLIDGDEGDEDRF